jgi:hypothetical protein
MGHDATQLSPEMPQRTRKPPNFTGIPIAQPACRDVAEFGLNCPHRAIAIAGLYTASGNDGSDTQCGQSSSPFRSLAQLLSCSHGLPHPVHVI